jgi:alkanesulfonate monooxygenase SsuD/methylene tetrahydromethanopterin reductase-like flavin-dependent oxidoreductase (luciferase family)
MDFGLSFAAQTLPGSGQSFHSSYRDMLDCLPEAEELGYSSVFHISHHGRDDGFCPSPLLALASAAAVTEKMRLGTAVLLVPLYHPVKLAEDLAVLDQISNGRVVLGAAPGYVADEFAMMGIPRDERNRRFEEALDLLQLAWKGEPFEFDGRYYQVPAGTRVGPHPVNREIPIWYGVSGPRMLANAAKRGCAVVASPRHTVEEVREHYDRYEAVAAEVGYQITERPMMREVFIAETQEEAERIAAPGIEYLFQDLYGRRSAMGERELRTDDGELVRDLRQAMFEALRGRFIVGDPEHARREVARMQDELGCTEMLCWTHVPGVKGEDAMRSIRLFAEEVMPHFQSAGAGAR